MEVVRNASCGQVVAGNLDVRYGGRSTGPPLPPARAWLLLWLRPEVRRSAISSQFRSTLADAQYVRGDWARTLVDHQIEAFCQKALQREVSGRQRGAS